MDEEAVGGAAADEPGWEGALGLRVVTWEGGRVSSGVVGHDAGGCCDELSC